MKNMTTFNPDILNDLPEDLSDFLAGVEEALAIKAQAKARAMKRIGSFNSDVLDSLIRAAGSLAIATEETQDEALHRLSLLHCGVLRYIEALEAHIKDYERGVPLIPGRPYSRVLLTRQCVICELIDNGLDLYPDEQGEQGGCCE